MEPWASKSYTVLCINLMFCWACIIVYQYNKTNVMHSSFSLLRIKSIYMFRALLAHPQEVLHKDTWYIVCVCNVSWLCHDSSFTTIAAQPTDIRKQYTKCRLCSAFWGWASMLETCRGFWFSINWMKNASRWFNYAEVMCVFIKYTCCNHIHYRLE
jgi:hypothetical protein